MLSNLSPLLLLTFLVCRAVADPLVAAKSPAKNLHLPLLNISQGYQATPTSNLSDVLTLPTPLVYGFSVPNTEIYLRLGFGLPRHRLDPMSLGGLVAIMQHAIVEGIGRDGEDAYPGLDMIADRQRFGWTLGDGFHFYIRNVERSGRYFTWEQVKNVVEGLRLFLIVGERYYATAFSFRDGPGSWWMMSLGFGGFVIDSDGEEEIFDHKI